LNQVSFPKIYATAGANNTDRKSEWGTGYSFTKIEGFYDIDNKDMSIQTGSTAEVTQEDKSTYTQGVDAYRNIVLELPVNAVVGSKAPKINIKADFDKLLSAASYTITLSTSTGMGDNATPNIHTAVQMVKFVDNIGGNG